MNGKKLKVVLMDEARDFIRTLRKRHERKLPTTSLKLKEGRWIKICSKTG